LRLPRRAPAPRARTRRERTDHGAHGALQPHHKAEAHVGHGRVIRARLLHQQHGVEIYRVLHRRCHVLQQARQLTRAGKEAAGGRA
jgi:hypothetical protein